MDLKIWINFTNDIAKWKVSDANTKEKRTILYLYWYFTDMNNGGHNLFFQNKRSFNLEEVRLLFREIFSRYLFENFLRAYKAYKDLQEKENKDPLEDIYFDYDQVYNKKEELITDILKDYAQKHYS